MSTKVSAVTIGVKDIKRSRDFYVALGLEVEQDLPGWVAFKQGEGAALLGLYPREGLAKLLGASATANGFAGVVLNYNGTRAEVDEVLAKAKAAGGTILKPAQDQKWGGRQGHFSDPDGYVWQVGGY